MSESHSRPIPTPSSSIPHHWWFDPRQTGVFNSSPPMNPNSSMGYGYGSSPTSESAPSSMSSSPDPKVPIPLPSAENWNKWRRDSLKNFYHLDDFATPE